MNYGTYRSSKEAIKTFIDDTLISAVIDLDSPETLNILQQFTNFLVGAELNKYLAEEEAEKQKTLLRRRLEDDRYQWFSIGIPAPITYVDNSDVVLTWKHPHYREITGHESLSPSIYRNLSMANQPGIT